MRTQARTRHTWNTIQRAPYMEHHTWSTIRGAPYMEHHTWTTIHGAPYMEHHKWTFFIHGPSYMDLHAWTFDHDPVVLFSWMNKKTVGLQLPSGRGGDDLCHLGLAAHRVEAGGGGASAEPRKAP
eukprot:9240150-Lingulodinium_polyedra.AAC.1